MKTKKLNLWGNLSISDCKTLPILTLQNASSVTVVINKLHPEWGQKAFRDDPIYGNHEVGTGFNSKVLDESEFSDWCIISQKKEVKEPIYRGSQIEETEDRFRL